MKVRPILFSGPMVSALIEGRKTQTRRVLKPQPETFISSDTGTECEVAIEDGRIRLGRVITSQRVRYAVGDVLWVRESWTIEDTDGWGPQPSYAFMADHVGDPRGLGWKPSIHMPRKASRLTLAVTGVKVERLQDISEADAEAEGCDKAFEVRDLKDAARQIAAAAAGQKLPSTYRCGYAKLWDEINGAGSWDANPWVVAVTSTVHQQNVDTFLGQREAA